jgi:1-acyl-sn-glycerol-3-phosphate acyltransferase
VSKKENFSIPIIGWLMRLNRYLEIDRGKKESMARLMGDAEEFIRKGNSIMMFPEGTRFPGVSLGPFKDGAFRMALDNKVDIIPILLDGTARALPKRGVILTGFTKIKVRVLDPVPYTRFAGKTPVELMNEIRELMSEEFARLSKGKTARTDPGIQAS